MSLPLERKRPESCLSDLHMDQLLAGEISDAAASRAHLRSCPDCAERFAEIEAGRNAFARDAPPLAVASKGAGPRRAWLWPAAGVAAAAAAAAGVALAVLGTGDDGDEGPGIRRKGGERIGFFVKHGDAVREGAHGEVVQPGDALQFTYFADAPRYLAILSVDGAAQVSVYFPDGRVAARIDAGIGVRLPQSTILDDTLGTETIYALFCDRAIDLDSARAELAKSPRDPPLPSGCAVDRLVIEKGP